MYGSLLKTSYVEVIIYCVASDVNHNRNSDKALERQIKLVNTFISPQYMWYTTQYMQYIYHNILSSQCIQERVSFIVSIFITSCSPCLFMIGVYHFYLINT